MTILEEIREKRRLSRMRLGQDAPEFVTFKSSPEIRVALVPLTEAEYEQAIRAAASLDVSDNAYGTEARDRWLQTNLLSYAIREPGNPSERVFTSAENLAEEIESVDVNYLIEEYARLVDDSSPALEGFTDEDLDTLKKALLTTDWSVLSGKPWWHLKGFLSSIMPEQLRVSSFGSSSTKKSIGTSESPESTPGA